MQAARRSFGFQGLRSQSHVGGHESRDEWLVVNVTRRLLLGSLKPVQNSCCFGVPRVQLPNESGLAGRKDTRRIALPDVTLSRRHVRRAEDEPKES